MGDERTTTLWRPVGPEELRLVEQSGWRAWPPRLPAQPIFYPVLDRDYAVRIARDWNVKHDRAGFVTEFDVRSAFLDRYEVHQVGGRTILEYWIPAEELDVFNANVVGAIGVVERFTAEDGVRLREAGPEDGDALARAVVEAVDWRNRNDLDVAGVLAVPALAHYVTGWPRPADFGTVAVEGEDVVGAAWGRLFPDDDPGYGFVSADVPELTIAIRATHRGRGLGAALFDAVLAQARERGHRAVSLSVEDGNRARSLYERAGFVVVGRSGTSDTMLLELIPS